jgi:hypothetical protein
MQSISIIARFQGFQREALECRYVLEMVGRVYGVDAEAREHGLTAQQRLELHRQRSAPVVEELHAWLERQFAERRTEPNSGLAKP